MTNRLAFSGGLVLALCVAAHAAAQEGEEAEGSAPEGEEGAEAPPSEAGPTTLRAPDVEPVALPPATEDGEEAEGDDEEPPPADGVPTPADALAQLTAGSPPSSNPTMESFSAPRTVFTLHGYFRARGELQDTFWLGRRPLPGSTVDPPFSDFRPIEDGVVPAGGCGAEAETDPAAAAACDTGSLGFANMRLRLEPTLSLSDDVHIHFMIDALDNLVFGSTPDGLVYEPPTGDEGFTRADRTPTVPLDSFASTAHPPTAYRNSLMDSLVVRRAWAQVTLRRLGQLRFGRMGSDWGLGLLANGGEGLDADYSSEVDRVMAITKLAGFYVAAAYDFASEGYTQHAATDLGGLSYDPGQEDDVDQYVLAVAHRLPAEQQRSVLERGLPVLNGGLYFVYREQFLSSAGVVDPFGPAGGAGASLVRRNAEAFIPDVWVQLLYQKLRVELEAVVIAGSIENTGISDFTREDYKLLMFGTALETEYRLLDDKLGLYLNAGFATGDPDVEGLTARGGLQPQIDDRRISTFRFHPNYRVDLILWRSLMRQVSGAYYFRPGISYDFQRSEFGELFGARVDAIWSRASAPVQTWGNEADLGIELNASLYYRSEDGPEVDDGFYGMLQYGVLFPMGGLGYLEDEDGRGQFPDGTNPELKNAQTLRLVLGVQL